MVLNFYRAIKNQIISLNSFHTKIRIFTEETYNIDTEQLFSLNPPKLIGRICEKSTVFVDLRKNSKYKDVYAI
jgi:hypothetical protein